MVRLVRSCLLEGKRRATTPPVHVGDLPIVLVHHLEVCLPDAIDCQVHLAQEERAVCLRGLVVLDRIDDPIPVVHQQVIFKEPDLYLQIIIFLEQLLLILLLDLLLRLILDLPHTTFHKMLLRQPFKNRVIRITRKSQQMPMLGPGVNGGVNPSGWPLRIYVAKNVLLQSL